MSVLKIIMKNWGVGAIIIAVLLAFLLQRSSHKNEKLKSENTELESDTAKLKTDLKRSNLYGDVMREEYNKLSDSKTQQEITFKESTDKIVKDYTERLGKKAKNDNTAPEKPSEPIITTDPTTDTQTLSDAFKTDVLTMDYKIHFKGEILGTEFYPIVKQKIITNNKIVYEDKPYPVFKYIKKDQFGFMYSYGFSNNLRIHDFTVMYKSKTNLGASFGVMLIDNKALENDMEYVPKVGVSVWF